ncbi:hypothetical protein [Variovorax sp. WS11]|uniref:hypothetical protein n=1 Tax=Variovorax sp. WS11 TaxID=1105204 RepID=UPI0011B1C6A9|nr:hypothetical protein [Variovorax sp. WS11]NDZ17019.1 hypothetical protein [Variovorax sp. WS11]
MRGVIRAYEHAEAHPAAKRAGLSLNLVGQSSGGKRHLEGIYVTLQAFGQRDELRSFKDQCVLERGGANAAFRRRLQMLLIASVAGLQIASPLAPSWWSTAA